jgi:hypothetical protein
MKRLLIGTALCALFALPASAAEREMATTEPMRLTDTQMDGVTAAGCFICTNVNITNQTAVAAAVGGSSFLSKFSSNASANALNVNDTEQEIEVD